MELFNFWVVLVFCSSNLHRKQAASFLDELVVFPQALRKPGI
jgi:hypothetical protein